MAYGANVFDTSNQLLFSTSTKVLVFGGSSVDTNTSNPERVTKGATVCQPYFAYSVNQGGFIDFRIEDTTLLPNTSDAALQLALVPFFSGPRPIGSAMVYKTNRSGCTMAYYNNEGFTANAGTSVSSMVVRLDNAAPSGIFASSGWAPATSTAPPGSEMQRARPCPQLMVGDVFQFTTALIPYTFAQTTYQGSGTEYTVQSITRISGTSNNYTVVFSPQKASAPTNGSILAVNANLNKVFVRAFIQNSGTSADNPSASGGTPTGNIGALQGNWNMYYFREIKNSDAGTGRYGMNVYDASGNLTFTSNKRGFDIAAMGVSNAISLIQPYNNQTGVVGPLPAGSTTTTGFFTTSNKAWDFGSTPTNYAVYAPIAGNCQSSPDQSLTPGTGRLTQGTSSGISEGVETGVTLWPTPSSTSTFCPAKVGPPNWGGTTAVTTSGYKFPVSLVVPQGSYIMVIDTDKYQP